MDWASSQRHIIKSGTIYAKLWKTEIYSRISTEEDIQSPPVRQNNSIGIVRFANLVTNTVNLLNWLGFEYDQELGGIESSGTRRLFPQPKDHWLRHLEDHRLLASKLIVFKDWLKSTAFIHEDLLPDTLQFSKTRKTENKYFCI